jgi:hypothetical protein
LRQASLQELWRLAPVVGRLLRVPGLRMERKSSVGWSELAAGYELRDLLLSVLRHPRGAVLRNTR